jgi:hypothetical protein
MESVYHIVTIPVNETSWTHVWRLHSRYLRMGYDTKARWHVAIICCSYQHSYQYSHHRQTAWSHDISQIVACVLCQQDPIGRSNMVPSSSEAALCSPYDNQKAQALLLGLYCLSRIRSIIGACPSKQRSNRADRTMDSGDRPIWCWIGHSTGDQVSSTHGHHYGVDRFRSVRHRRAIWSLGDVLQWILHS